jgi:hypothetical protein
MTDNNRDDIIERAMQRLIGGEALDAILRDYPEHAAELRAALTPAVALISMPIPAPSPAARLAAQHRLTSELRSQAAAAPRAIGIAAWLGTMRARPLAFQALAGVAAFAVFGGVGIGAAAAIGNTPQPIRSILRISSDSATRVHYIGTVVDIDTAAHSITIALANGTVRTTTITDATQISGEDGAIAFDALRPGDSVDVTAVQRGDGSVTATHVAVSAAVVSSSPGTTPAASPDGGGTAAAGADAPGAAGQPSSHESPGAGSERTESPGTGDGADTPEAEDGTPAPGSTQPSGGDDGDEPPEATQHPGSTEVPEPTHGSGDEDHTPEPTEKPEATKQPEPTEPQESEHSVRTPTPRSGD